MTDRIAHPWGGRTPFGRGEDWPVRVDQFLEEGVEEEEVDDWVQTASILHSNGDALDIAVKDSRMVRVRGRTVYHFHTRTKTKRAPQLDAAALDVWVEISPSDAESLGVVEGDVVCVESPRGSMEAKARISGIKEGVVFAPFHYGYFDEAGGDEPDGRARAANELTITEWDPVSKQPLFKVGAVRVTKVRDGGGDPSPAPTTTASAPEPARAGAPVPPATAGGGAAEATETVGEG